MKLPVVLLETHARCNCRCVMCDIWKSTDQREMSHSQLEALLPALERLETKWVVFTGGEPLMHSNAFALASPLRARGMRVSLLSTGLLFERFAERIADSFDDAILSLDGPPEIHDRIRGVAGAFERSARGVQRIYFKHPRFPITSRCVVQRLNHHQLVATAVVARQLGLRSISFLAADLTSSAFNRTPESSMEAALTAEQLPALEDQLRALENDVFVADSPRHLRRIGTHFRAHLGLATPEAPRCNAPWVSAVVGLDGSVKPCFFQPSYTARGPLDDVLHAPQSLAFRDSLHVMDNSTCRNCVCSLYLGSTAHD